MEEINFYKDLFTKRTMIQYYFRPMKGGVFFCIATSIEQARRKRDKYLKEGGYEKG
ncbi:hypothetical protein LCGC14_0872590 [marine sediment metagenome]|uniref:Uncharacterized protein n=1 Tax=marine sediment metagenome TaxID=412755 RepID=A0A0F9RNU4_9ZZZZ